MGCAGATTFGLGIGLGWLTRLMTSELTPIAAWGDSLTAGAGRSSDAFRYTSIAATDYTPPREIAMLGIGGQTSTQIAARMNAIPILVELQDTVEVTDFERLWDFSAELDGAFAYATGVATTEVAIENGQLRATKTNNASGSFGIKIGLQSLGNFPLLANGESVRVRGTIIAIGNTDIQIGLQGGGSGWASNVVASNVGAFDITLSAIRDLYDGTPYLLLCGGDATSPQRSTIIIDDIRISRPGTSTINRLAIPASGGQSIVSKNINILYASGNFSGNQNGWLAGVYGTMSTDSAGNWTFTREEPGELVECAADTSFITELGETMRQRIAWLWLGRNGAQDGHDVFDDIAAAVASLGHNRYLVGSILIPTNYDDSTALNARLKATYGARFVDVLSDLIGANDGSEGDLEDVASGYTPRSLRVDGVHLNDAGYAIVAAGFKAATDAMGW